MTTTTPSTYQPPWGIRTGAALLRTLEAAAPALATPLALRLFFTPLPGKWVARRRAVPAPWQAQRLAFEGASLTVWRRRDVAPDAPRVLLLHGWAGDAQQLRPLGELLAWRGFDAVMVDFPAHGRSDGWRTTLPQWSRALFTLTGSLGPWHGAAAHSAGAMALAHAAARGLPVQRLALLGTAPPPRAIVQAFGGALRLPARLQTRMRERIEADEGVPFSQFETPWLAAQVAGLGRPLPTLLVHDEGDRLAPMAPARALAAAWPGAQLHVTQGLGHRRLLSDDAVLQRVAAHLGGPGRAVA